MQFNNTNPIGSESDVAVDSCQKLSLLELLKATALLCAGVQVLNLESRFALRSIECSFPTCTNIISTSEVAV